MEGSERSAKAAHMCRFICAFAVRTQSMDVDETSDQNLDMPLAWVFIGGLKYMYMISTKISCASPE